MATVSAVIILVSTGAAGMRSAIFPARLIACQMAMPTDVRTVTTPVAQPAMLVQSTAFGSGRLVIVAIRNGHVEDGPVEREQAKEAEHRVHREPGGPGAGEQQSKGDGGEERNSC